MITLVFIAIGSWLILGALFLGYPTIKRLKPQKDAFGWVMKVPIYFALIVGLLSDVVFNLVWGSVIFRELPKEWLFTDRLKRHWRGDDPQQYRRAKPWVDRVNAIDPGHV